MGLYFPPFEPKQSSLLRAGIFKRLNELKNDGFFSKEVTIRKTMFDDCKGPKFEELLAVLSTAALFKAIKDDRGDQSITKKHLTQLLFDITLSGSLLLPYQASFSYRLRNRDTLTRRWHKFGRVLASKGQELDRRAIEIEQKAASSSIKRVPKRTLDRLRRHLTENWKGDSQWVDIVLQSDQHRPTRTLLQRQFSEIWSHACSDTLYAIRPTKNDSLLQSLEAGLEQQRRRLDRWKNIKNHLVAESHTTPSTSRTKMAENVPPIKAQKDSERLKSATNVITPRPRGTRERASSQSFGEADHDTTTSMRRSSGHIRAKSEAVHTPVSMRKYGNNIGRPLANTSARLATPVQLRRSPDSSTVDENAAIMSAKRSAQAAPMSSPKESQPDIDNHVVAQQTQAVGGSDSRADDIVSSVLNAQPSPVKPISSLADRTRMSLANMNPTKIESHASMLDPNYARPTPSRLNSIDSVPQTPAPSHNLAERTRQSLSAMAILTKSAENRAVSRARPSTSSATNQFQTPIRESIEPKLVGTPTFEETDLDADYDTIFKSRPRVAMSPVLKPMMETRESVGSVLGKRSEMSYEDDFS